MTCQIGLHWTSAFQSYCKLSHYSQLTQLFVLIFSTQSQYNTQTFQNNSSTKFWQLGLFSVPGVSEAERVRIIVTHAFREGSRLFCVKMKLSEEWISVAPKSSRNHAPFMHVKLDAPRQNPSRSLVETLSYTCIKGWRPSYPSGIKN